MVNEKVIRNPSLNCVVEVSRDEEKFRKKFPKFEDTKDKQLKCTVCSVNLTPFIVAGKSCHLHSFLKVLVCKKCLDFYGDGDFSVDEDGDEKYCRWCGQGGNLFLCEKCNSGFCKACVKRNFNRDVFEELKALDNWDCFMCNPNPLYELRAKAWAAETYYQSHRKEDRKTKTKTTAEDDESPKEKRPKKDRSANTESKFIDAGRKLLSESLDSAKRLAEQCKLQADKIQKSKLSKKRLKTPEDMRSMETKLQAFLDSFTENVDSIKASLKISMEDWQQHYDERFKNQANGDGKSEENGNECDAEEKEGDEDEKKKEKKGGEEEKKVEKAGDDDDDEEEVENEKKEEKAGDGDDEEEVENEKEDEKNETEEDGKEKEEDGKEKNDEVSSDDDEADGETKKDEDKEEEEKDEEMETTELTDAEETKVVSDSDANDDSIMDTTAATEPIDSDSEQKKTQD